MSTDERMGKVEGSRERVADSESATPISHFIEEELGKKAHQVRRPNLPENIRKEHYAKEKEVQEVEGAEERGVQEKPAKAKGIIYVVVVLLALLYFVLWAISSWQRSFELATGGAFLRQLEAAGFRPSAAALREERIAKIWKRASEAIRGTQQDGGIAQIEKKASEAFEAARQDGRLAQIRKKAGWHGRICATLTVLGIQPPLFGLLMTTIGIIMRFESVRVQRLLVRGFILSCLWGTFFWGAASSTVSRLAMGSREDSFIIFLGGAFMVWAVLTACFGLIIGVAALVRRLLRIPSNRLRIKCPKCGRALTGATRRMIGEIGVCPECKAEFLIGQVETEDKKAAVVGEELNIRDDQPATG